MVALTITSAFINIHGNKRKVFVVDYGVVKVDLSELITVAKITGSISKYKREVRGSVVTTLVEKVNGFGPTDVLCLIVNGIIASRTTIATKTALILSRTVAVNGTT